MPILKDGDFRFQMHIGAMGKSRMCVGILTYVRWQRHIGAILVISLTSERSNVCNRRWSEATPADNRQHNDAEPRRGSTSTTRFDLFEVVMEGRGSYTAGVASLHQTVKQSGTASPSSICFLNSSHYLLTSRFRLNLRPEKRAR